MESNTIVVVPSYVIKKTESRQEIASLIIDFVDSHDGIAELELAKFAKAVYSLGFKDGVKSP